MRREALQAFVHLRHPSPMDYRRSAYCHKHHGASIAMSFAIICFDNNPGNMLAAAQRQHGSCRRFHASEEKGGGGRCLTLP